MKFLSGRKPQTTLEVRELREEKRLGSQVRVNGAVHSIRGHGRGILCDTPEAGGNSSVRPGGGRAVSRKELKEGQTVEAEGVLARDPRAPGGIEVRLEKVRILSEPEKPLPLPAGKWKLNTSLEAKLNYRNASLRNIRERAKFRIQEGVVRGFRITCTARLHGNPYAENRSQRGGGRIQHF